MTDHPEISVKNLTDEKKLECASREIIQYLIENPQFQKIKITTLKNRFMKKYGIKKHSSYQTSDYNSEYGNYKRIFYPINI